MRIIFTFIFAVFTFALSAQTINGIVKDEKTDEPLVGANLLIKLTGKRATTNFEGKFKINAAKGEVIAIKYIGYESKNYTIDSENDIAINLKSVSEQLKETVVIGYGSKSRKDITGSVASVSTKEIEKKPFTRLENILQGQAAGVQVTQYSGKPGNEMSIRVRGTTSLSA